MPLLTPPESGPSARESDGGGNAWKGGGTENQGKAAAATHKWQHTHTHACTGVVVREQLCRCLRCVTPKEDEPRGSWGQWWSQAWTESSFLNPRKLQLPRRGGPRSQAVARPAHCGGWGERGEERSKDRLEKVGSAAGPDPESDL